MKKVKGITLNDVFVSAKSLLSSNTTGFISLITIDFVEYKAVLNGEIFGNLTDFDKAVIGKIRCKIDILNYQMKLHEFYIDFTLDLTLLRLGVLGTLKY